MDINATDIAALEKILHQAEEWMLEKGESPDGVPSSPGEEPPADLPPEEGEGEAAIEVEIKPEKPRVLDTYEFYGGAAGRGLPKKEEEHRAPPAKVPVGYGKRR